MNVLFISSVEYNSLNERNIYTDLLRKFVESGDYVWAISPRSDERQKAVVHYEKHTIIRPFVRRLQKVNVIKKGFALLTVKSKYITAIRREIKNANIDLIVYATPPLNIVGVVDYCKKKYRAKTYLLLKDIWPDAISDLGVIRKHGAIYNYFRRMEKRIYSVSDRIGCMSRANVDYLLKHNLSIVPDKIELCPNCIEPLDLRLDKAKSNIMRNKYGIPLDKIVFVYGGNLGKPQDIPYIIQCIKTQEQNANIFFLIIGDGTEFEVLEEYVNKARPKNVTLMKRLPKDDYDRMIAACDIGLIFLNHRFSIPNFPSRLLSYMQAGLPVLACTDTNTDIGRIIIEGEFGWWCESGDTDNFNRVISEIMESSNFEKQKSNSMSYLVNNYDVMDIYKTIKRLEYKD